MPIMPSEKYIAMEKIIKIQKIISLKVSSLGFEDSTNVLITKAAKTLNLFVTKSWCNDFFILPINLQRDRLCQ